jgi:Fe-Mn family superoxide dismutase
VVPDEGEAIMMRREFMAMTAAAAMVRGASAEAPSDEASALSTGRPKALKTEELKGFLSREQLSIHHAAHYGGAVKSLAAIEAELETADRSKASANWADIRELKREQVHAMNSVILHELYFDSLGAGGDPGEAAAGALKQRFGSIEKWLEDFKAAAISARGWAVLCHQPVNGKLYNVVTDAHDVGPLVFGVPLVVIDCYEHAFYVDYRNKKADYVGGFVKNVDWDEIERRVKILK